MAAILLAQFVVKGAVVLLAAWALTRLTPRASAAARHLVWTAGIAATLAMPLVPILGPTWTVAVPASWSAVAGAGWPARICTQAMPPRPRIRAASSSRASK